VNLSDRIGDLAERILGPPNKKQSTRSQLRFGTNGSVAVEIAGPNAGTWFDHEIGKGGGWRELLRIKGGIADEDIDDWLEQEGFTAARANGHDHSGKPKLVATYYYRCEQGRLLFQVCRQFPPKKFFQRAPDGQGGWKRDKDGKLTMEGVRRVPYHLPEIIAAVGKANGAVPRVYIVEGEKDADRLRSQWGLLATTNPGGAGKWRGDYNRHFTGFDVVILPDNDDAGRGHAQQVAEHLLRVATSVRIIELNWLPEKGDISDWMDGGASQSDLETLVELAEPFKSEQPAAPSSASAPVVRCDWLGSAQCDSRAEPRPNLFNVMLALREDVRIMDLFAYDKMLRAPVLTRPLPGAVLRPMSPLSACVRFAMTTSAYCRNCCRNPD
jgi:hypothetical protein